MASSSSLSLDKSDRSSSSVNAEQRVFSSAKGASSLHGEGSQSQRPYAGSPSPLVSSYKATRLIPVVVLAEAPACK